MYKRLFCLAAIVFCFNSARAETDGLVPLGDSGIFGPPYEEMVRDFYALAEVDPRLTIYEVANTVDGRKVIGLIIQNPEVLSPSDLVMISGSTHGNEYLNIADRLPEAILDPANPEFETFLASQGAFLIIPVLNPDGYERRRRSNSNGSDLNRSFPNPGNNYRPFNQPETKEIAEWVEIYTALHGTRLRLSIDYHCCQGSLLLPWAYSRRAVIPQEDYDAHALLGEMLVDELPRDIFGPSAETIGYAAVGTTMDYWYEQYGALAAVFEGRYRQEQENFPAHVRWWRSMVSSLTETL